MACYFEIFFSNEIIHSLLIQNVDPVDQSNIQTYKLDLGCLSTGGYNSQQERPHLRSDKPSYDLNTRNLRLSCSPILEPKKMAKGKIASFFFPRFLFSSTSDSHDSVAPGEVNTTKYLNGHVSYLQCTGCAAHLCLTSQIISKGFTGRHGRAYLVSAEPLATAVSVSASSSPTASLPNTMLHHPVPRQLVTGAHTVSDVSCVICGSVLGWKYVAAEEESQRYKVGKFILETQKITATACWETPPGAKLVVDNKAVDNENHESMEAEFDSQDEDECEDLFAGIWSPGLAIRRRDRKVERRPAMFGLS